MDTPAYAEQFTDVASTTVSSGGTTAPAAGTQESWTVASSSSFPGLSNTSQAFYVADPAAPTELVRVIAVSGTTWTVIRGAQGTAPVAHSGPGFTVNQVVSWTWYQQVSSPAMAYAAAFGVILP